MSDVRVEGPDLRERQRRIRTHADRRSIQKEMYAGLNRATKGIRSDQLASIPPSLPSRGGLAALVRASTRLSVRSTGGGIRIQAANRTVDLASLNRGRLRHPVFGRPPMVDQTAGVEARFLDEPVEKAEPAVRRELIRVMDQIARRVQS